jgi:uncharacterized protein YukE
MGNGKELLQKGGAGGYDIYVDPEALRATARAFRSAIERFAGPTQSFTAGSQLGGNAFGELPEARGPYQDYVKSRGDALKGLDDLTRLAHTIADQLDQSAANYDGADQASVAH